MLTETPTPPGGSGKRRWDAGVRAGVISAVIGGLALVVALFAWLAPQSPADSDKKIIGGPPSPAGPAAPTAATTATSTNTGPTESAAIYLDSAEFRPESGASDLVTVPRAVRGKPDYTGHEIAVRCPSNETGDQTTDITFLLRGRYAQFEATVHPYLPAGTDQKAATYVTALIGISQPDGSLDTTPAGDQKRASPGAPGTLSAPVDNAEKLTLRVQCGNPNGTVILTGARLLP